MPAHFKALADIFRGRFFIPTAGIAVVLLALSGGGVSARAAVNLRAEDPLRLANEAIRKSEGIQPKKRAELFRLRAVVYARRGDRGKALADCHRALGLDPAHVPTLVQRATLYLQGGDLENALQDARKAVRFGEQHPFAHLLQGTILRAMGRYREALDSLHVAVQRLPEDPQVWVELGRCREMAGNWDGVLEAAEQAVALDPDLPSARKLQSLALYRLGRDEEAMAILEPLIESQGMDLGLRRLRGVVAMRLGAVETSLTDWDELVRQGEQTLTDQLLRGESLFQAGRMNEALEVFLAVQEKRPDWLPAMEGVARSLHLLQRFGPALAAYQAILAAHPGHARTWYNQALVKLARGQYQGGLDDLSEAVRQDPGLRFVRLARARLALELDRPELAREDIRALQDADPEDLEARVLAGRYALRRGQVRDAAEAAQRVLAVDAEHARGHLLWARVNHRLGEAAVALEAASRARVLDPDLWEAHLLTGELRLDARDGAGALEALDAALAVPVCPPRGNFLRSVALRELGRPAEAMTAVQRALNADHAQGPWFLQRAWLWWDLKQVRDAKQDVEEAIERMPVLGEAYFLRAQCHWTDWEENSALDDLGRAEALGFFAAGLFQLRADILLERLRSRELQGDFLPSLQEADAFSSQLDERLYERTVLYEEIEANLRQARELAPDQIAPILALARLALQRGDVEAAESFYREVLNLDPNQAEALEGLESLLSS